ncbi:MAG: hypothetical protein WCF16_07290, partial [Alphaproteobacteria bacterium]
DARRAGIPVYYGEVLSEPTAQTLDLTGIGYLIAATDNDAYNALACTTFAHELGRGAVLQLAFAAEDRGDPEGIDRALRGRGLISAKASFDALLGRVYSGWRFHVVTVPDQGAPGHAIEIEDEAMPVLAIREGGALAFNTADAEFEPKPGDAAVVFAAPTWKASLPETPPATKEESP